MRLTEEGNIRFAPECN